ncbi:MAG: hypothetical protein J2P45_26215 [Candidatus Dormibacteraeota bacterium]|nr:hypothetical protein [Candidatus Dormibacteraeota bacterium]
MTGEPEVLDPDRAELAHLEHVWEGGMRDAYTLYRVHADRPIALAAAMVEAAAELQGLGGPAAGALDLLLGDLCLARASRLLAATGDQRLQVGFARVIEKAAAGAVGASPCAPLRAQLLDLVSGKQTQIG